MRKKRFLVYIIMVLSVVVSVKLVRDIYRLWHAEDRMLEADKELLEAKEGQLELKQQLGEVGDGQWWERQVRDKLMMARPNEEVVVIPEEVLKTAERMEMEEEREGQRKEEEPFEKWWQVFVY